MSLFELTSMGFQLDQSPLGTTCHRCQTVPSVARTKISSRPSVFEPTPGVPMTEPSRLFQPDQSLFGASCQRCQTASSEPTTKISRRPSSLRPTPALPLTGPPEYAQLL